MPQHSAIPAGTDPARIALRHAREDARRRGPIASRRARRPRAGSDARSNPVPLSTMFAELIDQRGWDQPDSTTATVLSRWPAVAGPIAARLKAVAFDPATGALSLSSDSPAWATQALLLAPRLVNRINTDLGFPLVKSLHILRAAAIPGPTAPQSVDARPRAAEGEADPCLRAALDRQDTWLSQEPRSPFTDVQKANARPDRSEVVRARAMARARGQRKTVS